MRKKTFLFDNIKSEDKFDVHTHVANTLSDKIIDLKDDKQPINIGLFGEWGSGKSFIIQKIDDNLKNEDIEIYQFDAWKFNGKALERSILFTLEEEAFIKKGKKYIYNGMTLNQKLDSKIKVESELKVNFQDMKTKFLELSKFIIIPFCILLLVNYILTLPITKDLIKHISNSNFKWIIDLITHNNIGKIILSTSTSIISIIAVPTIIIKALSDKIEDFLKVVIFRREDVKEIIMPTFSSDEFEKIFIDMIEQALRNNKSKKVVLVFDNIDRCEAKFAYEIITTIKTYMNLDNCIYIIPCDDEALKNYLNYNNLNSLNKHERNYEQEFLDKFFQVSTRIPKLATRNIDKFIEDCLNEVELEGLDVNEKGTIKQILYYAYKKQTPRKIKRFINDFSFYYSIAVKVDSKREFLLHNIEMFTILVAIKQRWPLLESDLVEDMNFREYFYSDKSNYKDKYRQKINKEFGNELIEFLDSVKFMFYNEESLQSYIYYLKQNNDIDIIEKIKKGEKIDLNVENYAILLNNYKKFKENKDTVFLYYMYKCLINSLTDGVGEKYSEVEGLFNDFTHDIYESKLFDERKGTKMIVDINSLFRLEINHDFSFLDKINMTEKSQCALIEMVLDYMEACIENEDAIKDFESITNIKKIINSNHVNRCYLMFKKLKSFDKVEFYNKIIFDFIESIQYISDANLKEISLDLVANFEFDNQNEKYFDFVFKSNDKINFLIEIANETKEKIQENGYNIDYNNLILNIGILISKLINNKVNIQIFNEYIDYIKVLIVNNYIDSDSKIIETYFGILAMTGDDVQDFYKNKVKSKIDIEKIIIQVIKLFGQQNFIDKLYNNLMDGDIINKKFSSLIEQLDVNIIIDNFDSIGLNPIFIDEIKSLHDKLFELENKNDYLTKKIINGINSLNNDLEGDDDYTSRVSRVNELMKSFEYLECKNLINNNMLKDYVFTIKKLYVEYPQEIGYILTYCIKSNIIEVDNTESIFKSLITKLRENSLDDKYDNICDILSAANKAWGIELNRYIEDMLNEILIIGRDRYIYDIGFNILKIYKMYYDIDKYENQIMKVIENGYEKFELLLKSESIENPSA